MTATRADAARNRARLLEVARELADRDGGAPALAELAERAGLGVGTVYRHFASRAELQAALASDRLAAMLEVARAAADAGDPRALERFVGEVVPMLVSDADLAAVFTAPEAVGDARAIRTELIDAFGVLVSQAHAAGALHPDLGVEDLHHLVCGIQVAVRLSGDAGAVERYVGVLLAGVRA